MADITFNIQIDTWILGMSSTILNMIIWSKKILDARTSAATMMTKFASHIISELIGY